MKKTGLLAMAGGLTLLIMTGSGCALGAGTAGYAAKASTADSLSSDGLKNVTEATKNQVVADLIRDGKLKSDQEVYNMVVERMKKEGYIK